LSSLARHSHLLETCFIGTLATGRPPPPLKRWPPALLADMQWGGAATGGGLERQAAAAAEYDVRLKREDAQTQLQFYQTVSFELT
jgi:hypothetical protein